MRGLAALLVVLAASLPLACSAGDKAASVISPESVAAAATKTAKAKTYRASFDITTSAAGQTVRATGRGLFDAKGKRGRMTLQSTVQGASFQIAAVLDWPVMYMRLPAQLGAQLPAGKHWVSFNFQSLGKKLGFDFQQIMQASQTDPGQALGYLRGIQSLEKVDKEEVRGVETTHYKGVVDLRKAAEEMGVAGHSVDRIIQLTGIASVPTEVWLDESGLVRRMRYDYRNMRLGSGQRGDMTMVTELYDFGVRAHIAKPPAGQVVDLENLIGQG